MITDSPPYKLVIYSGGKCGGSSLYSSFINLINCIFIHKDEQYIKCKTMGIYPFNKPQNNLNSIFKNVSNECFFIDVYRNTIDRCISAYFQNYEHNQRFFKIPKFDKLEDEVDYFNIFVYHKLENYEGFEEVLKHYNIDKLHNMGNYFILRKHGKIFLRLKFDKIDLWEDIISKELKLKIDLRKENMAQDKSYHDKYIEFKKIYYKNYL